MTEPQKIALEVRHRYTASPERVFDAWLDPEGARRWLFATEGGEIVVAEIDPRVGGGFRFTDRRGDEDVEHVGEYLEIDRPRRLVFRFGVPKYSPDLDRVTIDVVPADDGGCVLTLRHETAPEWVEGADAAWSRMLEGIEREVGREGGAAAGGGEAGPAAGGERAAAGGDGGATSAGAAATAAGDHWAVALDASTLRFERLLPGPVERLWAYLTEPDKRARWLAGGTTEPRVGGCVELRFQHAALSPEPGEIPERYRQYADGFSTTETVTVWEPPRRFGLTWGDGAGGSSEAIFELTPAGDDVRLVLTHRQIPPGQIFVGTAGGWHTHLAILGDVLEGRTPPSFWRLHVGVEEEYGRRLGA